MRVWIAPLLLGIVVSAIFARYAWRATFDGLLADGYVYLLMADALREVDATRALDWRFLFGEYPFPPLYPLLLALVGAGADTPAPAIALNAGLLGAAFAVLVRWYANLGIPTGPAFALCVAMALLPITFLTALDVQSEPLYLLLSLITLTALVKREVPHAWLVAGVCCGLAILTRTVGIALLAAFTWVWFTDRPRRVLPLLCAWLPYGGWSIFRWLNGLEASYLRHLSLAPSELLNSTLEIVPRNLRALSFSLPRSFDLQGAPHVGIVLVLLGLCASVVFLQRLRKGECDAVYLVCYLGLVMAWPHPDHLRRFMFVVLPMVGGYAMYALWCGCQTRTSRWSAQVVLYAVAVVIALLALPSMVAISQEYAVAATPESRALTRSPGRYFAPSLSIATAHAQAFEPVITLLKHARTELPVAACISSAIPEQVMFYARRPGIDLIHGIAAPAALLRDCPYVLMVAFRSIPDNGVPPMFPYPELRSDLVILDGARVDAGSPRAPVRALLARYRAPPHD